MGLASPGGLGFPGEFSINSADSTTSTAGDVREITSADSPHTVIADGRPLVVDATGGDIALTLPAIIAITPAVDIYRVDSSANIVTLSRGGTDTLLLGTGSATSLNVEGRGVQYRCQPQSSAGRWLIS